MKFLVRLSTNLPIGVNGTQPKWGRIVEFLHYMLGPVKPLVAYMGKETTLL